MDIVAEILNKNELLEQPPVVLDIGASKEIHPEWESFAQYSICIAFDADDRQMGFVEDATAGYKKLIVYNRIVTETKSANMDFYLTKYPFCSSLLYPDNESLDSWSFSDLFEVEKIVNLETVDLKSILSTLNVKKIDWFKTDSQGTDFRLFKSLGEDIINKLLVADFEPGIMDAYKGEDKVYKIMEFMDTRPFWMSDIEIKGPERINLKDAEADFLPNELLYLHYGNSILRNSPGWAEMSFINNFSECKYLNKRDYLLGFVFAYVKKQYGYCIEIANKGFKIFNDSFFTEIKTSVVDIVKNEIRTKIIEESTPRKKSGIKQAIKKIIRRV